MIATIEQVWRRMKRQPLVPLALLVMVRVPADPTRRTTGYVGVLPVPATTPATTAIAHTDGPADQARRDLRAARGRVLYATGHEPQATTQHAERKATCPSDRRVVQSRAATSSPNS
jgi:hypothetical protein